MFLTFEFACQVALLFPHLAGLRVFFRSAPFVACLMLLMLPGKTPDYHPARSTAIAMIVILAVSMLHPLTNSLVAGARDRTLESRHPESDLLGPAAPA